MGIPGPVGRDPGLSPSDGRSTRGPRDMHRSEYMVICPAAGLVGVRMIEAFDGYVEARDGFAACQDLLRELH